MLLKHPTAGTIIDVTGARAKTLLERGYTEADADDADLARQAATGEAQAVQPQPPIDARPNPPEPPVEARPAADVPAPPIDTRPPNPLDSQELSGDALDERARELDIKGRSKMSADELREAIAKAEADRSGPGE